MKFLFGLSAIFLSLSLFASPAHNHYRKFIVIVPVYRELYSENIGSLLTSLYNQDLTGLDVSKIDVWFVVNNTADADADVRLENQETVTFLKRLAAHQVPTVRRGHKILREAINTPLADRLNIHVLDYTTPGRPTRNIGEIRDLGVKSALQDMDASDLNQTLVAQMDADTGFQADYTKTLIKAFETRDLKFALNNMSYDDQPDSEARVYQRKITTDYRIAAFAFRYAYNGELPPGGGPRIVATAEAMLEVGGVPHEVVGEDTALILNLQKQFPENGLSLDNTVLAKFRARDDGYDAAIYKKQLEHPIEFSEYDLGATKLLQDILPDITRDPLQKLLYEEALSRHLRAYQVSVAKLTGLVHILIHDLHSGTKTVTPGSGYPALMNNSWFIDLLQNKIAAYGPNENQILADLTKEFPYYFSNPPTPVTVAISELRAATQVLLQKPFLKGLTEEAGDHPYLSVLREKYPSTAQHLIADNTTGKLNFVPSPNTVAETQKSPEEILEVDPATAEPAVTNAPPSKTPSPSRIVPPSPQDSQTAGLPWHEKISYAANVVLSYATSANRSFNDQWHRYFNWTGIQEGGAATVRFCHSVHAHASR